MSTEDQKRSKEEQKLLDLLAASPYEDHQPAKGKCSVCGGIFLLRFGDGMIRYHGPHPRPCPGGGKPPIADQQSAGEDQDTPEGRT